MPRKRRYFTVKLKLQAVKVAESKSKEACKQAS